MKVGFDLDGVICEGEVTRTPDECVGAKRSRVPIPSREHEVYIISSRTGNMEEETRKWLAENEVDYERLVLYGAGSFEGLSRGEVDEKQASFKTEAVNELELDVYVEDRPTVRKHLQKHCSNCIVLSPSEAHRIWRFET